MSAGGNRPGKYGLIILFFVSTPSFCQESELLNFEKSIEKAVVATDIPFLEKAYADDFRFKHGTGLVDSKSSWLKSVGAAKGKFISRETDSVEVEIHGPIGITNGRLTVRRKGEKAEQHYMVKYVRVYVKKDDQWQLIMHRSVFQKNY